MAISGNVAVAGAGNELNQNNTAYIFERNSSGTWHPIMHIEPDNVSPYSAFGQTSDIDGNVIVIGAPFDGPEAKGSAFIYRRVNDTWIQSAKLVPDDEDLNQFGTSVTVVGDLVAIADPLYGDLYHGAVFVYRYDASSDSWNEFQDPITNDNCGRFFGSVVSLTNDQELMVGCYVQENDHPGAVYYYSLQGDQFELRQTIVPPNAIEDDFTEIDQIEVDGDLMLVKSEGFSYGQVHVFAREDNVWRAIAKIAGLEIAGPMESGSFFGYSLALSNRTAVVSTGSSYYVYDLEDC